MAHRLLVIRDYGRAGRPGAYGRMDRDAAHDVITGPAARGWLL